MLTITKRGARVRDAFLILVLLACAVMTVVCSWQGLHPVETVTPTNSAPVLTQQGLSDLTGQTFSGPTPVLTAPDTH